MQQQRVDTPDGISWHVERLSDGSSSTESACREQIVLIPSGEGDCHNLATLGSLLASSGYNVLSFDLPGFSRTTAPKEAYERITPQLVAKQIITLLDTLEIKRASFFGNSSGGGATLALIALYPERVKCGIVHEVPFAMPPNLAELPQQSDEAVTATCQYIFANFFIEQEENDGRKKWDALGTEYHDRLAKNYVTWVRGLMSGYEKESKKLATPENLKKRPIFWTVGGLSDVDNWKQDFDVAEAAGIEIRTDVLKSLHFPYVSVPEQLAQWIGECIGKVQDE